MINRNGSRANHPVWEQMLAQHKAQQQQKVGALQQGGFDALFRGAQPVQGMGSMEELLGSGNQFFNPFGTATPYSADQVRQMQQSMPMSIGEGSRVLYKGQVYDNPMGGQMAMWNAMTPQQRNAMVSGIQGAGAGTWREQDYMAGGGTPVPSFGQLGANTGIPATGTTAPTAGTSNQPQPQPAGAIPNMAGTMTPGEAERMRAQLAGIGVNPPAGGTNALGAGQNPWAGGSQPMDRMGNPMQVPGMMQGYGGPQPSLPFMYAHQMNNAASLNPGMLSALFGGGGGGGGLLNYGGGQGGGMVPGGFGGYGSQVVRYF